MLDPFQYKLHLEKISKMKGIGQLKLLVSKYYREADQKYISHDWCTYLLVQEENIAEATQFYKLHLAVVDRLKELKYDMSKLPQFVGLPIRVHLNVTLEEALKIVKDYNGTDTRKSIN